MDGGMQESDVMRIFGWRSPDMVRRYGASAADERSPQDVPNPQRPTAVNARAARLATAEELIAQLDDLEGKLLLHAAGFSMRSATAGPRPGIDSAGYVRRPCRPICAGSGGPSLAMHGVIMALRRRQFERYHAAVAEQRRKRSRAWSKRRWAACSSRLLTYAARLGRPHGEGVPHTPPHPCRSRARMWRKRTKLLRPRNLLAVAMDMPFEG